MNKDKVCPQCGFENFRIAQKCKGDGCGHVFFEKKPYKRREKATPVEAIPGFSAGFADDGALLLFWYGKGEFTKLTPDETALVIRVLGSQINTAA